jgi:hypothetical protein
LPFPDNLCVGTEVRIRDALHGSIEGVPHPGPTAWKKIQAVMLEAASVKNWATLAKGAKSVGLECDDVTVKMVRSSNYENKGGTPLPEKAVECEWVSSELGHALVMAFTGCS